MNVSLTERPRAAADPVVHELVTHWGPYRRMVTSRAGETVFACVVRPGEAGACFVTDCLPQRDDPAAAAELVRVCRHLAAERGMTDIVAIHPDFWTAALTAAGATALTRMVPMALRLDAELLGTHERALPAGYRLEPLRPAPDDLGGLSPDGDRDNDLRVWREVLSGDLGPLVPDASVRIVAGGRTRAALAITLDGGTPLVGHCVVAPAERGGGLGRAVLVGGLLGLAEAGYATCRLNVVAENWTARRLYRSLGFVQDQATLRASRVVRP